MRGFRPTDSEAMAMDHREPFENAFLGKECETRTGIELREARRIAEHVAKALEPVCNRIEIAGSIRRSRACVNDIDFVVIPKDRAALRDRVLHRCVLVKKDNGSPVADGEEQLVVKMSNGVQLDFFFAHDGKRDLLEVTPSNWGSVLLCRTGSKNHNIFLCVEAGRRGLHWNPPVGLMRDKQIVASVAEADIFRVLDLGWIEPERRER